MSAIYRQQINEALDEDRNANRQVFEMERKYANTNSSEAIKPEDTADIKNTAEFDALIDRLNNDLMLAPQFERETDNDKMLFIITSFNALARKYLITQNRAERRTMLSKLNELIKPLQFQISKDSEDIEEAIEKYSGEEVEEVEGDEKTKKHIINDLPYLLFALTTSKMIYDRILGQDLRPILPNEINERMTHMVNTEFRNKRYYNVIKNSLAKSKITSHNTEKIKYDKLNEEEFNELIKDKERRVGYKLSPNEISQMRKQYMGSIFPLSFLDNKELNVLNDPEFLDIFTKKVFDDRIREGPVGGPGGPAPEEVPEEVAPKEEEEGEEEEDELKNAVYNMKLEIKHNSKLADDYMKNKEIQKLIELNDENKKKLTKMNSSIDQLNEMKGDEEMPEHKKILLVKYVEIFKTVREELVSDIRKIYEYLDKEEVKPKEPAEAQAEPKEEGKGRPKKGKGKANEYYFDDLKKYMNKHKDVDKYENKSKPLNYDGVENDTYVLKNK